MLRIIIGEKVQCSARSVTKQRHRKREKTPCQHSWPDHPLLRTQSARCEQDPLAVSASCCTAVSKSAGLRCVVKTFPVLTPLRKRKAAAQRGSSDAFALDVIGAADGRGTYDLPMHRTICPCTPSLHGRRPAPKSNLPRELPSAMPSKTSTRLPLSMLCSHPLQGTPGHGTLTRGKTKTK